MGKAIMIQGTSSGAGKSTFVIGLCRALKRAGFSVAPFKAQNISLNAHVFENKMEMARSQALAAYACGIEPTVDMNPVLMKPTDIRGSDIILKGEFIGNLKDFEYKELKKRLSNEVIASYNRLLNEYDIIVVEGAGSPVELNLKENDIVNMGFAKKVKCPVILISDISRGGVFASVYGTVMLFEEEERKLVKGIVINKFRGFTEYFSSGVEIIEKITNKTVLGVIPDIEINLEDEDSLTDNGFIKTKESIEKDIKDGMTYEQHMELEFDKLAKIIEENIDLKELLKIMGV